MSAPAAAAAAPAPVEKVEKVEKTEKVVPKKAAAPKKKAAPKRKGLRPSLVKKAMKASKVPIMKCVIDCTLPLQDKILDINAFVNTTTHT